MPRTGNDGQGSRNRAYRLLAVDVIDPAAPCMGRRRTEDTMTTNRKAKTAARALAAESGRSYTHARRLEAGAAPADSGPLARLHREALAFAELLEQADPFLEPWGTAARRLAEVDDPAEFHAGAERLAWDIDNLRGTPNGHKCDALFRWNRNPVGIGHALAQAARAVALDRCEVDERDRPCDGPRTLTLSVWTVDGLSEVWEPLCIGHTVDYALRWDPSYAELVVSGEPEHDARNAVTRMLCARPGEMNVRMPGAGEDKHGRRLEASPLAADDGQTIPADKLPMHCAECGRSLGPADGNLCESCGMDLEVTAAKVDPANDGPAGFAESWEGSGVTPEQLVADARAARAEQYPDGD
jgi:hypothetical protein